MLESVSLHQTRFNAPGIAPDPRGIVLGKQGAVLVQTVDSLVAWLRILSDEIPLDDLLPSLVLSELQSGVGSLAFLVLFHAESSYLVDRAARIAALIGGATFTGSGKHLVRYRDAASPLGYDVDAVSQEAGDFIVYDERFALAYRRVRDVPFAQLVMRLSPRRLPGKDRDRRQTLWLTVAPGLARGVLSYLHRNRVAVAAAMVEREGGRSSFGEAKGVFPPRYLLARTTDLPERMLDLFDSVPGIAVYRPATDNVLVEIGYRHPLHLESCRQVFDKERYYLFSGRRDAVDVIAGPTAQGGGLALVEGERLIAVGFDLALGEEGRARTPAAPARPTEMPTVRVTLRLVPSMEPPRRVTAALVGWERAGQLKRLVFALPPTVLGGCRVASILDGLFVIGSAGVEALPLGEPFYEVAPSLYAPLGFEFLPRASEAILTEYVGGVDGRRVVFKRGADKPIAIAESAFEPLSRRVLGRIEVESRQRDPRGGEARPVVEAQVVNDPAGLFPLWGYRPPRTAGE